MSVIDDTTPSGDLQLWTLSDTVESPRATRGVYVGTSGNLRVLTDEDQDVIIPSLAAGVIHPLRIKKAFSTSTTAANVMFVF